MAIEIAVPIKMVSSIQVDPAGLGYFAGFFNIDSYAAGGLADTAFRNKFKNQDMWGIYAANTTTYYFIWDSANSKIIAKTHAAHAEPADTTDINGIPFLCWGAS